MPALNSVIRELTAKNHEVVVVAADEIPETIEVNGKIRPTTNNLGKPIHATLEGIRNFWNWFGDSKSTDKSGQPLVVFHGTNKDFSAFDPDTSGTKSKTGAPHSSFFFTEKADVASSYTVKYSGDFGEYYHDNSNVMPCYLKMLKPLKISAKGNTWRDLQYKGEDYDVNELAAYAKNQGGYDSVIVTRIRDKGLGDVESKTSTTFVVFSPTQVKSALGNSGAFSPNTAEITASTRKLA